jgi:hypothetical protein
MGRVSDRDEAEAVELLGRDVKATLGMPLVDLVRSTAHHHRQFTDDRDAYVERVVEDIQQYVHDGEHRGPRPSLSVRLHSERSLNITVRKFELVCDLPLERAFKTDVSADDKAVRRYREAHSVLSRGDHYLLVMIDQRLKRYLRPWWNFSWT